MSLTLLWIVITVMGLVLLIHGVRGRRLDEHPVCRRCRFDLTGLNEGVRCPECGGDLAAKRAVRIGNRRRRGWAIGVGLPALLIGLIIGGADSWRYFSGFDLNTIKPTGLLVWELERMSPDRAGGIATELTNRVTQHIATASAPEADRKAVEKAHLERMRDRALAVQADRDGPWLPEWGDLLYELAQARVFEREHWEQFLHNGIDVSLSVRSEVQQGERALVRTHIAGPRVGSTSIPFRVKRKSIRLGQRPLRLVELSSTGPVNRWGGLILDGSAAMDGEIGDHLLEKVISLEAGPAGVFGGDWDLAGIVPVASIELTFAASVKIVPPDDEVLRVVHGDELKRDLLDAIRFHDVHGRRLTGGGGMVSVSGAITLQRPVVDVIADVYIAVNGIERKGGQVKLIWSNAVTRYHFGVPLHGFSGDRATLILRPNRQAALELPGVTEVFGGELVFEDIEIEMPSQ